MDNKNPIDWHEERLRWREACIIDEQMGLDRLAWRVSSAMAQNRFYSTQISEAKRRGLLEFDREKFMVKRKNK